MTRCNGQVLTAITDTSAQEAQLKVSVEPTPRDTSLRLVGLTPCSCPFQISPTALDI